MGLLATQVTADNHSIDLQSLAFKHDTTNNVRYYAGLGKVDLTIDNLIGTVKAAVLELCFAFTDIKVYKENNGQAGFQWNLKDPVWDCSTPNIDCFPSGSQYSISLNSLTWTITYYKLPCPSGAGYNANCSVWVFNTTGTTVINGQSYQVLTITWKIPSQTVVIDGVEVAGSSSKADIYIRYPWDALSVSDSDARIVLVGVGAGKAGSAWGVGSVSTNNGVKKALYFSDDSNALYLSWDSTANGGAVGVHIWNITGDDIDNTDCGSNVLCNLYIPFLKTLKNFYAAFGWKTELLYISWDVVKPDLISYDPGVGQASADSIDPSTSPSAAGILNVPVLAIASIVFSFFYLF